MNEFVTSMMDTSPWFYLGVIICIGVMIAGYATMSGDAASALSGFFVIFFIGIVVTAIVFTISLSVQEKDEWKAYAAEHCKVIEKRESQATSGVGVSMTGKVGTYIGSTDAQTAYKCDDGVTYWKND
ncbi:TPA: hypothetical protein QIW60_003554 [Escherichia coli]|nr:hypothetical protein [Escherichia coli]